MRRSRGWFARLAAAVAVLLVVAVSGCSDQLVPESTQSEPTTPSSRPSNSASESGEPTATPSVRDDLAEGPVTRTLKTGDINVRVSYSSSLPPDQWSAAGAKPVAVNANAKRGNTNQKVYLSKVTIYMDVRDESGPLDAPNPLEDTAVINPGFLFSGSATYGQEFYVPPLATGATSVTLRIRYEMLLDDGGGGGGGGDQQTQRDYSRQTVTDALVVALH